MTTYYEDATVQLHHGDCLDVLRGLPDNSVDSVVTDPPYGLEFMGKEWDSFGPQRDPRVAGRDGAGAQTNGVGFGDGSFKDFKVPAYGTSKPSTLKCDTCNVRSPIDKKHSTADCSGTWIKTPMYEGAPRQILAFGEWCELWATECLRVLKPGGHLLAFGGTRTWHRLACAVEDAGFEVRDSIAWMYGSGFPKSLDVSKAIDKRRTEDEVPMLMVRSWLNNRRIEAGLSHDAINKHFGHASNGGGSSSSWMSNPTSRAIPTWEQWQELKALLGFDDEIDETVWRLNGRKGQPGDNFNAREVVGTKFAGIATPGDVDRHTVGGSRAVEVDVTAPATPDAERWQGWGTALKPAFEPVVVARKPLTGTVASNVLAWGTGALNIDGCRVGTEERTYTPKGIKPGSHNAVGADWDGGGQESVAAGGRWPANVVLDESQAAELDQQSGESASPSGPVRQGGVTGYDPGENAGVEQREGFGVGYGDSGGASRFFYVAKADAGERVRVAVVAHPTVKPLALMRWLVRLVTPPGGTVLEPFAGSGTTVEACILEGFHCLAIEREADYLPLIVQRINRRRDPVAAVIAQGDDAGLFDLLDGEPA